MLYRGGIHHTGLVAVPGEPTPLLPVISQLPLIETQKIVLNTRNFSVYTGATGQRTTLEHVQVVQCSHVLGRDSPPQLAAVQPTGV